MMSAFGFATVEFTEMLAVCYCGGVMRIVDHTVEGLRVDTPYSTPLECPVCGQLYRYSLFVKVEERSGQGEGDTLSNATLQPTIKFVSGGKTTRAKRSPVQPRQIGDGSLLGLGTEVPRSVGGNQ